MAKYERTLKGNFRGLLSWLHHDITSGSISASYEDGSNVTVGNVEVAVRVYERYSMIGQNRLSLSVTVVGDGSKLFVSAIASGGSQAVFFKINTFGENSFLNVCRDSIERYVSKNG